MADLKTNYKDRLLDTSVNTERKFNLVDSDGNVIVSGVSLRDITQYSQTGDTFGAADINKITAKINEQNNSLTELETKVLWTNESINTEFVAQSINIDLSQYKYIEILYCIDTDNELFYSTGRLIIGKSSRLNQTFSSSDGAPRTRSRSVSISQNAVTFEVAYEQRGNSTSRSVNNTYNIPYKIIGYK